MRKAPASPAERTQPGRSSALQAVRAACLHYHRHVSGGRDGLDQTTLSDVSCGSDQNCVAVGTDSGNLGGQSLAETMLSGSWTPTALPDPPAQPYDQSSSVSCSSSSSCVSVGNYINAQAQIPFAESLNSGTWTASSLPLPKGTPPNPGGGIFFSPSPTIESVSCVSTSWCVAVGQYEGRGRQFTAPLIEIFDAGTWTVQSIPKAYAELSAVSCTMTASCVAVGAENNGGALVATLSGTSGRKRRYILRSSSSGSTG
jgi:hypothetical protein